METKRVILPRVTAVYTTLDVVPEVVNTRPMARNNILCVTVDGIRPDSLGCYGAADGMTPALDVFATESTLFDFAFAESTDLRAYFNTVWQGDWPVVRLASEAGLRTVLFTDELSIANAEAAQDFAESHAVASDTNSGLANSLRDCRAIRVVQSAVEWVRNRRLASPVGERDAGWLLWLHFGGLAHHWDAPLGPSFDDRKIDAIDPDILSRAPCELLSDDELAPFEWLRDRYVDQIEVLDCAFDVLWRALLDPDDEDAPLFILAGTRGFPLGEHRRLGIVDHALFEEFIHVPLMIRHPAGAGMMLRASHLAQNTDIAPTIADALRCGDESNSSPPENSLLSCIVNHESQPRVAVAIRNPMGERGLRTKDWYLRSSGGLSSATEGDISASQNQSFVELYSKPDDRWDQNEVSDRCQEIVSDLRQRLES